MHRNYWNCPTCGHTNGSEDFNCDSDDCRASRDREEIEETRRAKVYRWHLRKVLSRTRDVLVEHDVAMFCATGRIH